MLSMHRVEILGDEFFAQPKLVATLKRTLQYFVPAVGLQDGDVVVFFYIDQSFPKFSYARRGSASVHHRGD